MRMQGRGVAALCAAVTMTLAGMIDVAQAREPHPRLPASAYDCVAAPVDAPTPPPLPATAAQDRRDAGLENAASLCEGHKVPVVTRTPRNDKAPAGQPGPVAQAVNDGSEPYCKEVITNQWRCHQTNNQYLSPADQTIGLFANLSVHAPSTDWGSHSLAQLWAFKNQSGAMTTAEIGWRVDPSDGAYRGNYPNFPHLFVYRFDNDAGMGYAPAGGWIPAVGSPVTVGQPISPDGAIIKFGVQRFGSDWWFYYGGYWFGSYPVSAYRGATTPFETLTWVAVGGEVSAAGQSTCSDMGNGQWGSLGGALVDYAYRYLANGASYFLAGDPNVNYQQTGLAYNLGYLDPSRGSFRYGGPGWC